MNTTELIENPNELWNLVRKDEYLKSTAGVALGYLQTNLFGRALRQVIRPSVRRPDYLAL